MKVEKADGSADRKVLIGMITDPAVISRISSQWNRQGLFADEWSNMVATWAVKYYRKYNRPIARSLVTTFEEWQHDNNVDETIADAIGTFLGTLSNEYETFAGTESEYVLDLAKKQFNRNVMYDLIDMLEADLEEGRVDEAQNRLNVHRRIELGTGSYSNPLSDFNVWEQAFDQSDRSRGLLRYRGAAGEFFRNSFLKGELYGFAGPDKTGKTTFLLDATYRCLRAGYKVAFFDVGDGDDNEFILKLACRATDTTEDGGKIWYPQKWKDIDKDHPTEDDWKPIRTETLVDRVDPMSSFRALRTLVDASKLRISSHPNSSITADEINGILMDWEREEEYRPDVVVIDYADILAPPPGINDTNKEIDETWKSLRRMTQSRHVLGLTATQTNAAAYGLERGLLSKKNYSGRKTKNAHVNGMIGINVAEDEREMEVARLNWIVRRKMKRRWKKFVTVAGVFDSYNPVVLSR